MTATAWNGSFESHLRGTLLLPGEVGYEAGRTPWNLGAHHDPAMVVLAETMHDIVETVRFARRVGLGVGVMATGHGATTTVNGDGLLVNTSRMRQVSIDARRRLATVAAGARWGDVMPLAARHGLAGLQGSSSDVGVVGSTLGGGFGWLGRRYGLASGSVTAAEVVTADGELVRASADEHPDLFWALRGGTGNFGIVTSLEFALHPVRTVYAGNLYYPLSRARNVLETYAAWSAGLPDEMGSAATFRRFPPVPTVPEPLRGGTFVALRACWCGEDLTEGQALVQAAQAALGEPVVDTFGPLSVERLDTISSDPVDPLATHGHTDLIHGLGPNVIDALVDVAGPEADSPLVMLEVRQLGGALRGAPEQLSPMAHTTAAYSVRGIGITPNPEAGRVVLAHLERVARSLAPHATGDLYLNFLDHDTAAPEQVRAAYTSQDWERLCDVKAAYDPDGVFRFNRNISNEPTLSAIKEHLQ